MNDDIQKMLAARGLNIQELVILDVLLDTRRAGLADKRLETVLHELNGEIGAIMTKLGCGRVTELLTLIDGFARRMDALDED